MPDEDIPKVERRSNMRAPVRRRCRFRDLDAWSSRVSWYALASAAPTGSSPSPRLVKWCRYVHVASLSVLLVVSCCLELIRSPPWRRRSEQSPQLAGLNGIQSPRRHLAVGSCAKKMFLVLTQKTFEAWALSIPGTVVI